MIHAANVHGYITVRMYMGSIIYPHRGPLWFIRQKNGVAKLFIFDYKRSAMKRVIQLNGWNPAITSWGKLVVEILWFTGFFVNIPGGWPWPRDFWLPSTVCVRCTLRATRATTISSWLQPVAPSPLSMAWRSDWPISGFPTRIPRSS